MKKKWCMADNLNNLKNKILGKILLCLFSLGCLTGDFIEGFYTISCLYTEAHIYMYQ